MKSLQNIPKQIWILVLVILLGVVVGFMVIGNNDGGADSEQVSASRAADTEDVLKKVSRHINLPEGTPVVVEIKDIDLLLSQSAFYYGAQNGDVLLLFAESQRAMIYSPSRDLLVNVGPVQFDNSGDAGQSVNRAITIEVRNGSGVSGEAGKLGRSLNADVMYAVIGMNDAANTNYTETIVVNRTGATIASQVQELADRVEGRVVESLPLDEANSLADVIIIIGK